MFRQRSHTVAKVLQKIFRPRDAASFMTLLAGGGEVTEARPGGRPRLLRRHSARDIFLQLPLQVKVQLLAQGKVTLIPVEQRTQTTKQAIEKTHAAPSWLTPSSELR